MFHLYNSCWRHQMETFSTLLATCAGNSPVPGEFPSQRPVTRSFDVFFDLRLNKWLSKQWWGWWFDMLPRSLWRHCNVPHCACNIIHIGQDINEFSINTWLDSHVFSCDQAALWMVFSVRLSVCPSVCLSVCLSVRHTFLTMFPSSYHHEIFRSYHQGPG